MCSVVVNSLNFVEGAQIHHPFGAVLCVLRRLLQRAVGYFVSDTRCLHLVEQKASLLL